MNDTLKLRNKVFAVLHLLCSLVEDHQCWFSIGFRRVSLEARFELRHDGGLSNACPPVDFLLALLVVALSEVLSFWT